jgi:hypothetical protein
MVAAPGRALFATVAAASADGAVTARGAFTVDDASRAT